MSKRADVPAEVRARGRVDQSQKIWKYVHDANTVSFSCLNRIALTDGKKSYTYSLMFRQWERYASVFSALGMTWEEGARVGILGSTSVEVIFSLYGLNMVGADVSLVPSYRSLTPSKVIETIQEERLTDFIVTDDFSQANLVCDLLRRREELGLRNVLVLHVPVDGSTVNPALSAIQEAKHIYMQGMFYPYCMENLLDAHENHPINYELRDNSDTAIILHTSGTTSGSGKPVALCDRAVNAAVAPFFHYDGLDLPWENLVTAAIVDLSNAYSLVDQVHVAFAMGATVVCVPGGILNPWFYKAIPAHGITLLFTVSAMFERWIKHPADDMDFSSLRLVLLGGAAVSAADKQRYDAFLRQRGAQDIRLINGYGISELGGACCLSSADLKDESIGLPLPGVSVRLLDEERGTYLSEADAPCEGVLYLNSPAIATAQLDGREILETQTIGEKPYICTNDLVALDQDGTLTFLGRANRYFIHDKGKKYESGRVETEMARQQGIESCCVVPVYVKTTHDNIPMLCATVLPSGDDRREVIQNALRQVFVVERTLDPDNVPARVLVADRLPRNANGKIDLFSISHGAVEGEVYTVKHVRLLGKLADFRLHPYREGPSDMIQEVFDGLSSELKSNMPFGNEKRHQSEREGRASMDTKKAFEEFDAMSHMGKQMVENVAAKVFQNAGAGGEMPNPFASVEPVPMAHQQASQMIGCMQKMNEAALGIMQKTFEQNAKMVDQFFETVESLGGKQQQADSPAQDETPVEPQQDQEPTEDETPVEPPQDQEPTEDEE